MRLHQEVDLIRTKMGTAPWPKYIGSLSIRGMRGWNGQGVRFPFPVTVVCGQNGTGKSTVLKAAAAAYSNALPGAESYAAGTFFPDTAWDQIRDATITYHITQGNRQRIYSIRKPTARWRLPSSKRSERAVVWQDVSRTLPIESTVGYSAIAKRTASEVSAERLNERFRTYYSSILGRRYQDLRFATSDADTTRSVGVASLDGVEYSQFHQGAGEDATLDLMLLLQNVPDTALLLIDEVEASLHPRSQRRLIHFLLWLARTKHIQVILSTHSPFVLEELPPEARVFLSQSAAGIEVMYGVSSEFALSRMDDRNQPEVMLYCEDTQAHTVVYELLRANAVDVQRVKIVPVGPADAVRAIGRLAAGNHLPVAARGVLDADEAAALGCLVLPGNAAPEVQIFRDVRAQGTSHLAVALQVTEAEVQTALDQAMTETDHHKWPSEAARLLGQQNADFFWTSMGRTWVAVCLDAQAGRDFADEVAALLR